MCRLWKDVAEQASLWLNVDLSYGWVKSTEATLSWLCHNRLTHVRELNLTSWKELNNEWLKVIEFSHEERKLSKLNFYFSLL